MEFEGKVVLISGGGTGIGSITAAVLPVDGGFTAGLPVPAATPVPA